MIKKKYFKSALKCLSNLGIFIQIITLSIGIFYFIFPTNSLLYDLLGYVVIFSWVLNAILIYIIDRSINKNVQIEKQLNKISYFYLALFIACMLLMVFGVIFSAFIISGILLMLGNVMIISGFLITLLYGLYVCILTFTNINTRGIWKFE